MVPAFRVCGFSRQTIALVTSLCLMGSVASAQSATPTNAINGADTVWVLVSAALVLLMTPGLAFFYGGMVRSKNVLGTLMQSMIAMGVIGLQWILFGYSLAFGPDYQHLGIIGNLSYVGLKDIGLVPGVYAPTIPAMLHMLYQCMFAVITPALIAGAFAERKRFSTYILFILLWATLVYDPVAHWIWGKGGWLGELGVIDFAGGIVVHVTSGLSALVAAVLLGTRKDYPGQEMRPHNLVWTILGAGLLWFGWIGFNGGSALAANGVAVLAVTNTFVAASAGGLVWMIVEWGQRGKPTALGLVSGTVAGLAGVTPASGYVGVLPALFIGAAAGFFCYFAVNMKSRMGYDDSLDTFGVHGISGAWGSIATGLFATAAITHLTLADGHTPANGLFYGNAHQLLVQFVGVVVVSIYSIVVTYLILKALDATMGLRLNPDEEDMGMDLSQHGEEAYVD